jgi:hypothetical protein
VPNLPARIAELRAEGYSIYKNTSKEKGTSYKLGKPTRAMIATAYAVMGAQAFA